jgi:rhamnosyltransferase
VVFKDVIVDNPLKENSFCVIVTYFPDSALKKRIEKVSEWFAKVIVVDNCSDSNSVAMLESLAALGRINLIKNSSNLGIAFALNQGISKGFEAGYQWVLTLDQDTQIESNIMEVYNQLFLRCGTDVLILGCNYFNVHKNKYLYNVDKKENGCKQVKSIITSGMLVHRVVFDCIGYFREDFFIDSVDHEFCLRARKKGFKIALTLFPLMRQTIGEFKGDSRPVGNFFFNTYRHSPERNYYIVRNTIVIIKEYFMFDIISSTDHLLRLLVKLLSIMLYEDRKVSKLRFFFQGFWHGITNKMDCF